MIITLSSQFPVQLNNFLNWLQHQLPPYLTCWSSLNSTQAEQMPAAINFLTSASQAHWVQTSSVHCRKKNILANISGMNEEQAHIWSRIHIISSSIWPWDQSWTKLARLFLSESFASWSSVQVSVICICIALRWLSKEAWCTNELLNAWACTEE